MNDKISLHTPFSFMKTCNFIINKADKIRLFLFNKGVRKHVGDIPKASLIFYVSGYGNIEKIMPMDVHRQCLLFCHAYIRKQCLLLRPVS